MREREACPVCAAPSTGVFFSLPRIPVQDGLLWQTRAEALASPLGDIRLSFCSSCGHIFNAAFEPEKIRYERGYDISLHHSKMYRDFIDGLVARLVAAYDLRGKTVLEIACGNGDFLREICARTGGHGTGFDPSLRPAEAGSGAERLTFVPELYSAKHASEPADFVCCRHLLQSLPDPGGFADDLRQAIGGRRIPIYIEVPNASRMFQDLVFWYITYEYFSFFSGASLARLFELHGFEVGTVEPCFEGNYLGLEAWPSASASRPGARAPEVARMANAVAVFEREARRLLDQWRSRLDAVRRSGKKSVAWGAGGRAITFLSVFELSDDQVAYVVDINPNRQGLYLPKTGQRVVSPDFLRKERPDVVLITNSTFEKEIRAQIGALGLSPDVYVL